MNVNDCVKTGKEQQIHNSNQLIWNMNGSKSDELICRATNGVGTGIEKKIKINLIGKSNICISL